MILRVFASQKQKIVVPTYARSRNEDERRYCKVVAEVSTVGIGWRAEVGRPLPLGTSFV